MLLGGREPDHRHHAIRVIRDVVEIVAIIAAGFWAFYIFVYENRIKPSLADPQIGFSVTMEKTSVHNGLIGVRLKSVASNTGPVTAYVLGYALTVLGRTVTLSPSPMPPQSTAVKEKLEAFYHLSKTVQVYASANVTNLGNSSSKTGLVLEPGANVPRDFIFYVPAGRFDQLEAYIDARFTKDGDKPIPTTLVIDPAGYTHVSAGNSDQIDFLVDSLDLNGK